MFYRKTNEFWNAAYQRDSLWRRAKLSFIFVSRAFLLQSASVFPFVRRPGRKWPSQDGLLALGFVFAYVNWMKGQLGRVTMLQSQTGPFANHRLQSFLCFCASINASFDWDAIGIWLYVCLCSYNGQTMEGWLQLCLLVLRNGSKCAFRVFCEFAVVVLLLLLVFFCTLAAGLWYCGTPSQLSDSSY